MPWGHGRCEIWNDKDKGLFPSASSLLQRPKVPAYQDCWKGCKSGDAVRELASWTVRGQILGTRLRLQSRSKNHGKVLLSGHVTMPAVPDWASGIRVFRGVVSRWFRTRSELIICMSTRIVHSIYTFSKVARTKTKSPETAQPRFPLSVGLGQIMRIAIRGCGPRTHHLPYVSFTEANRR